MMDRRKFTKTTLGAVLGAAAAGKTFANVSPDNPATPYKLKFAPNLGQMKESTKDWSSVDKIKYFYDCGFRALEDNGMPKRPVEEQNAIAKVMSDLGMEMGVFCALTPWKSAFMANNILEDDTAKKPKPNKEAVRAALKKTMEDSVELAKRVNAKWCTVVPGLEAPNVQPGYQFVNVVENLKFCCEILEKTGLIMVLEPLNIEDHPLLWLKTTPQAYAVCKAVNSPCCKILFDIYHQQITEGNLITNIDTAWSEIAYFQQGDVPGRKEPGTGEINYKKVFKHIHDKGYRGIYGMEHGQSDKTREGDKKLLKSYRLVDLD